MHDDVHFRGRPSPPAVLVFPDACKALTPWGNDARCSVYVHTPLRARRRRPDPSSSREVGRAYLTRWNPHGIEAL